MNVYRAYNGFTGYSAVHCIVVAADEASAKKLARAAFKKDAQDHRNPNERYWKNIQVEILGTVTDGGWASEVVD